MKAAEGTAGEGLGGGGQAVAEAAAVGGGYGGGAAPSAGSDTLRSELATLAQQLGRRTARHEQQTNQLLPLLARPGTAAPAYGGDGEAAAAIKAAAVLAASGDDAANRQKIEQLAAALDEVAAAVSILAVGRQSPAGGSAKGAGSAVGAGPAGKISAGSASEHLAIEHEGGGDTKVQGGGSADGTLQVGAAGGVGGLLELMRHGRVCKKLDELDPRLMSMVSDAWF